MTDKAKIEAAAKEIYRTDPRVNATPWDKADVQLQSMYMIFASTAFTVFSVTKPTLAGRF
jgi:hypothetical protein